MLHLTAEDLKEVVSNPKLYRVKRLCLNAAEHGKSVLGFSYGDLNEDDIKTLKEEGFEVTEYPNRIFGNYVINWK